jgi:hypothetical protein
VRNSIYIWHTSFAETGCIHSEKKNLADSQVVRLWSLFVLHFSVVAEIHKAGERGIS